MGEDKKVLIISGGKAYDDLISALVSKEQYSLIIAADSGLNAAERLNLKPDCIVGDFDSVSQSVLEKYKALSVPIKTFPREKDMTDTQISLELAMSHKPARIDIVAATGCRLDHVLANIHLLMNPMQAGIDAFIIDINNKIYLRNNSFDIEKDKQFGNYVSLLPFSEKVTNITLKGFKYPLEYATLLAGSSLGISNEIVDSTASVIFEEGILLVIESKD